MLNKSDILTKIIEVKRKEVGQLYADDYKYTHSVKSRSIPHYSFIEAILRPKRSSALIAEVKKASPSKGLLREDFNPLAIAKAYQTADVDCLSVLTEQHFFQGHGTFIAQIKAEVELPVLRKDFIIDPVQVEQSVELGADAILLIAKILPISLLQELYHQATELGLDVLIEIHDQRELEIILAAIKPKLIGINNRDLTTFNTSLTVTKRLKPLIPEEILVVSESGLHAPEMLRELELIGVQGFLIGEYFMRQKDMVNAVEQLYA